VPTELVLADQVVQLLQQHVAETDVLSSGIPSTVQHYLKRSITPVQTKHGRCQPELRMQRSICLVLVVVAFQLHLLTDLVPVEVLHPVLTQLLQHKY
jgi:hypothetical protein